MSDDFPGILGYTYDGSGDWSIGHPDPQVDRLAVVRFKSDELARKYVPMYRAANGMRNFIASVVKHFEDAGMCGCGNKCEDHFSVDERLMVERARNLLLATRSEP